MVSVSILATDGYLIIKAESCRWFAYDTICQLSFGEPLGFVKEGRDIESLIENFYNMAPFAAIVGALPWLARPFLENPITRRFAMPKPGDGTGTGKIMAVRLRNIQSWLSRLTCCISLGTSSWSNGSMIPNPTKAATFSTTFWHPKTPMDQPSRSTKLKRSVLCSWW